MKSLATACWSHAVMRSWRRPSSSSGRPGGSRPRESRPQRGSSGWHQGTAGSWWGKEAGLLRINTNGGRQWQSIWWKRHLKPLYSVKRNSDKRDQMISRPLRLLATHFMHLISLIVVSVFNKPIKSQNERILNKYPAAGLAQIDSPSFSVGWPTLLLKHCGHPCLRVNNV